MDHIPVSVYMQKQQPQLYLNMCVLFAATLPLELLNYHPLCKVAPFSLKNRQ
jgi:hypothetical protein